MGKKRKSGAAQPKSFIKYEITGLLMLTISGLSLAGMGWVGKKLAYLFMISAGKWYWILGLYVIFLALFLMIKRRFPGRSARHFGFWLMVFVILTWSHLNLYIEIVSHSTVPKTFSSSDLFSVTMNRVNTLYAAMFANVTGSSQNPPNAGGGILGFLMFRLTHSLFDSAGTVLVLTISSVAAIILMTGQSFIRFLGKIRHYLANRAAKIRENAKEAWELMRPEQTDATVKTAKQQKKSLRSEQAAVVAEGMDQAPNLKIRDFAEQVGQSSPMNEPVEILPSQEQSTIAIRNLERSRKKSEMEQDVNYEDIDPLVLEMSSEDAAYETPPVDLLEPPYGHRLGSDRKDLEANAVKLQETLASFGVQVKVTEAHRGPTVTRYEVQPAVGVKVSRIVNLADDLALALAAKDIRIEAPIPGKAAIGIEVPNREVAIVTLREVIESTDFQSAHSKLSIVLGRDISGAPIVGNLAKMPHLLVAGATGSGKSVCINGIITSILYKAKPSEVKFIMIDPKMVELNVYNGIPHLLSPVVTDPKRAAYALKKVVQEMEHRYELFAKEGARNMEGYNAMMSERPQPTLPYIILIIDELADLMMVAPGDVEDAICRLAQMARAAGIHLILATQRPSVDVITGVIKANIPSRIAFSVSSQMDSRTILDMGGAEKLLGRGDMLYLPMGESKPIRVQGAFLSDLEVDRVVNYVKNQQIAAYHIDLTVPKEETQEKKGDLDPLFWEAVKLVVDSEQASVSMIQRRLKVGYARAARLVDQMEDRGIVGPFEGSKPREVLLTPQQWEDMQNQQM